MNVIITGGTKGIGRAIADYLHSQGANLTISARNKEDLQSMKSKLMAARPDQDVHCFTGDMGVKLDVERFAKFILERWSRVDVLINNAGYFVPGDILTEDEGVLDSMIQTNLMSAYHLTRRIAPIMQEQHHGYIFNMCSVASLKAYPAGGAYSISKYALLGFSDNLREELKTSGIKVTAILPGPTWSASWAGVQEDHDRLMEAKDIAIAVKAALDMSAAAVVETIIMRPQLGDL